MASWGANRKGQRQQDTQASGPHVTGSHFLFHVGTTGSFFSTCGTQGYSMVLACSGGGRSTNAWWSNGAEVGNIEQFLVPRSRLDSSLVIDLHAPGLQELGMASTRLQTLTCDFLNRLGSRFLRNPCNDLWLKGKMKNHCKYWRMPYAVRKGSWT